LLERLLLSCERLGIKKFYVQTTDESSVKPSLGRFANHPDVLIVSSFDELGKGPIPVDPSSPCLRIRGNLVLSTRQLESIIDDAERRGGVVTATSVDPERGGTISIGVLGELMRDDSTGSASAGLSRLLPFALNGRPKDREEAELRLAKSLREDTRDSDAAMARYVDRNLSWRISRRLAATSISANQVTLANTAVGLLASALFASTSYWLKLLASILFLFSITVDGVDGELARLTMTESKFGGRLDVITDNIVHVTLFAGIFWGCYRTSGSDWYLWLLPISLGGLLSCGVATWRAFQVSGEKAEQWIKKIDRLSGRDFAYLLVVLALFNRLSYFAWGTAFGTYVFAFVVLWATYKRFGSIEADA